MTRALDRLSGVDQLSDVLRALLAQTGFALAPAGRDRWAPYVFETADALGWHVGRPVAQATAAVECTVAAIDVVDDLIDDEWDDPRISRSRATNASLALAFVAQWCALDLVTTIADGRVQTIQTLLNSGALSSCAGQDVDLLLESAPDVDPEAALHATIRKSGSLGAMACQVGAAICADDPLLLQLIGIYGRHLGTCAQLLNDPAGVDIAQVATAKSDLRRRKKTVPIAYLLECARRDHISWVLDWYAAPPGSMPEDELRVATLVHDLGGLQYTWVLADSYHREARIALDTLVQHTKRPKVDRLKRLLPSVRARSRV